MAIPAVGIDVESVHRFEAANPRLFTDAERDHCQGRAESLAGVWCVKEAVVKALARWRAVSVREVEVTYDGERPVVHIEGFEIEVSISHTGEHAAAVAIAQPISPSS